MTPLEFLTYVQIHRQYYVRSINQNSSEPLPAFGATVYTQVGKPRPRLESGRVR